MRRKMLCVMLSICMVLTLMPQMVFAETSKTEDGFSYTIVDDGNVTILKWYGSSDTVTIPDKIENKSVTVIADNAFAYCGNIVTINIPTSVK